MTTAATTTTYDEIILATGFAKANGEPREQYLKALAEKLGAVPDETWNGLSKKTQQWYNDAASALNSNTPAPPLEGFDEGAVVATPAADAPAGEAKVSTPTEKKTAAAKPTTKKAEGDAQGKLIKGISETVREMVIRHPEWTNEDIQAELLKLGWEKEKAKMSSITTLRADTLNILRIVKNLGWLPPDNTKAA